MSEPKFITTFVHPAGPSYDWESRQENYEPGDPIGRGPTEMSAEIDLIEKEREKAEADCPDHDYVYERFERKHLCRHCGAPRPDDWGGGYGDW